MWVQGDAGATYICITYHMFNTWEEDVGTPDPPDFHLWPIVAFGIFTAKPTIKLTN